MKFHQDSYDHQKMEFIELIHAKINWVLVGSNIYDALDSNCYTYFNID